MHLTDLVHLKYKEKLVLACEPVGQPNFLAPLMPLATAQNRIMDASEHEFQCLAKP